MCKHILILCTVTQILPYIDGVDHVAKVAARANVELDLAKVRVITNTASEFTIYYSYVHYSVINYQSVSLIDSTTVSLTVLVQWQRVSLINKRSKIP